MRIQSISSYAPYSFKGDERKNDPTVVNVGVNGAGGRIGKTYDREYLLGHFMPSGIYKSWDAYKEIYANQNLTKQNMGSMGLKNGQTINDVSAETIKTYFRNDSILGRLPDAIDLDVTREDGKTYLNVSSPYAKAEKIQLVATRENVDFSDGNVEIIIDATGAKTSKAALSELRQATPTAKYAILSAPAKDKQEPKMPTVVAGVNSDKKIAKLIADGCGEVSSASCTTTCISPIVNLFNEAYGIESMFMNTVHAATATQDVQDRSKAKADSKHRGLLNSTEPTTTGAANAIKEVLEGIPAEALGGQADRVPVSDGSEAVIDMVLKKKVTKEEVVDMLNNACKDPKNKNLLAMADPGSASVDVIGRHESALIVPESIQVINGNRVIVKAYYDNEAGYTRSLATLSSKLGDGVIAAKQKA